MYNLRLSLFGAITLMRIALVNASVFTGGDQGTTLSGDTLSELARKHQIAQAVIARLHNFMDSEALRAVADGVALNLDTVVAAEATLFNKAQPCPSLQHAKHQSLY